MSDDMWRRRRRERDETGDYGGPLFPEDDDSASAVRPEDTAERRLRFGPNDTGPLPHWTEPPTGEVPRVAPNPSAEDDEEDDFDVWSSFTTESPVWRDDLVDPAADPTGGHGADPTGGRRAEPTGSTRAERSGSTAGPFTDDLAPIPPPPSREPGRITIGTDSTGRRPPPGGSSSRRRSAQPRSGRPAGPARTSAASAGPRDLPAAIIAGVVLAALFIGAILWRPAAVVGLVAAVLAIAAYEYLGKVTEKGYRPAVAPALAACISAPLVAYWIGDGYLPLVLSFGFMAAAIGFIGASGVDAGPLPNMAVTTMCIVWIGLLGSFAALIVRIDNLGAGNTYGTDTLFLVVLGVVANDIGGLLVGSAIGRTPVREWISPGKTLEGILGGTFLTFLALVVVGLSGRSDTWTTPYLLILALIIAVLAPLGDLVESMFKRNLDVKDFGTVLAGHGGILDRFDSFLFVLPVVYYVTLHLQPWTR